MAVLLIPNTSKAQAVSVACHAAALLQEYGVPVLVPDSPVASAISGARVVP